MLFPYFCYIKLPEMYWLKTTQKHYLTAVEVSCLKWVGKAVILLEARGESVSLLFQFFRATYTPWFMAFYKNPMIILDSHAWSKSVSPAPDPQLHQIFKVPCAM